VRSDRAISLACFIICLISTSNVIAALSAALQSASAARIAYLQSANHFLAAEVAQEQAMGSPLP
jgi:hypothetical protein